MEQQDTKAAEALELDSRTAQDIQENPSEWVDSWGAGPDEIGATFQAF